jgi:hypothetical protein
MRCALAACCIVATACTPIDDVRHAQANDAGTTPDEPGKCHEDRDCIVHSPCLPVQCVRGSCVEEPLDDGTVLPDDQQQAGDCNQLVCDGRGQAHKRVDDSDLPPNEGDPCRSVRCENGQHKYADKPDSSVCNTTGTCEGGTCSACNAGIDCSEEDHCTVQRTTCKDNVQICQDTRIPRQGKCSAGKVCDDGSCVPCTVGAECHIDGNICQRGRISSCDGGLVCDPEPLSGPTCGTDEMGRTMYCIAGACTRSCREGSCSTSTDPCQVGRWDCTSESEPRCMMAAADDGTACGDGMTCHAGACVHSALVNGDFSGGLRGWTASGDAAMFRVGPDPDNDNRPTLSTSSDGRSTGGAIAGSLAQMFTVPDDALALRFTISGGHAHVRLKDADGNVLHECAGRDSGQRIAVSWELGGLRGARLSIAIEDDVSSGDWAYVTTTGFDVVRDIDAPLRNPQFLQNLDGWETTGDGLHFYVFDTYNYFSGLTGVEDYGRRRCITSYVRDMSNETTGSTSQGTASQMFIVPPDAVALRFAVEGGSMAAVQLQYQNQTVYTVSALDDDAQWVLRSWDLTPYRGKAVRLQVVDSTSLPPYGYIGTTGFDLITSYNGP